MPVQTLPRSAERYAREQRAEIRAAVAAARRQWRRMGPEFDASFLAVAPSLRAIVETAQGRVAEGAQAYIPAVLEETGQGWAVAARAEVVPDALVGYAGDGRPVNGLLEGAKVRAKQQVASGRTSAQALAGAGQWLSLAVGTVLSDTGRQSEVLGMAVRPIGGYVRMLTPPSCSRCAILAGRVYMDSQAFQRHPGCDCRHIPASESVAQDLTVDTRAYFDSLDETQQARTFTNAGAEAIREGADPALVVNARRGMNRSQAGRIKRDAQGLYTTRTGFLGQTGRRPRLMPESIRDIATDKDDYLRLLRANGYLR